ncbi:MAG: acyltransferase family protein [Planctomycetota bacterium]
MTAINTTQIPSHSSPSGATVAPRRHDLDALRAFAMLLGIALHAALAFAPIPWLAMNKETSPAIGTFIEVLHGFRLPLFFLLSGFFSAMLLQRRGATGFLGHRWKRIGLPLLLGLITIIPAMWGVILGGHALQRQFSPPARDWSLQANDDVTIWNAASAGDIDTVRRLALTGSSVHEPDGQFFTLPLAWAASGDHAEVVAFLLELGADPNQRMGDDNTPMHTACFFGAGESAALMLDAGGDPKTPNKHGETPIDAMQHGVGVVSFISNLLGVEADFERVQSGRIEITELLATQTGANGVKPRIRDRLKGLFTGELFMHLWFLWHLCWLTCGLVVIRLVLRGISWNGLPEFAVATPLCLVGLLPLTTLTQSWQANFGPDTSAALLPAMHVVLHYAVFFGFGVLMHGSAQAADRLGRTWWLYLVVAGVSCTPALELSHDPAALVGYRVNAELGEWLGAFLQSVFVWTVSFGLIGLSRRVLNQPRPRIRYISDSSYWLYIAHLPIVLAGQFALMYISLPPMLEVGILTAATTVVLLLSYQWFVRYTWIGHLLNGRRVRVEAVGRCMNNDDQQPASAVHAATPTTPRPTQQ